MYVKSSATAQVAPELLNRAFQIPLRSGEDSTLSGGREGGNLLGQWGVYLVLGIC